MDDKSFHKESADDWIATIEASPFSARDQDIYPILQRWIETNRPGNVLDVGCGQGICSAKLILEDLHYVGVDPSPMLIERAKQLHSKVNREFVIGNIYSLPFQAHTFEAVFSVAVWHLLENSQLAASEISRILKPSGSYVLITADPSAYPAWTDRYEEKVFNGIRFEGTNQRSDGTVATDILYLRRKEEILKELEIAGLKITSIDSFRNQVAIHAFKL
jgi:SAM-dependent methyltransferase